MAAARTKKTSDRTFKKDDQKGPEEESLDSDSAVSNQYEEEMRVSKATYLSQEPVPTSIIPAQTSHGLLQKEPVPTGTTYACTSDSLLQTQQLDEVDFDDAASDQTDELCQFLPLGLSPMTTVHGDDERGMTETSTNVRVSLGQRPPLPPPEVHLWFPDVDIYSDMVEEAMQIDSRQYYRDSFRRQVSIRILQIIGPQS